MSQWRKEERGKEEEEEGLSRGRKEEVSAV
jgi:hypothetical protein